MILPQNWLRKNVMTIKVVQKHRFFKNISGTLGHPQTLIFSKNISHKVYLYKMEGFGRVARNNFKNRCFLNRSNDHWPWPGDTPWRQKVGKIRDNDNHVYLFTARRHISDIISTFENRSKSTERPGRRNSNTKTVDPVAKRPATPMTRTQNSLFLADKSASRDVKKTKVEPKYQKRQTDYNSHSKTETVTEPDHISFSENTDSVFHNNVSNEPKNAEPQYDQTFASGDQPTVMSNGKKASPYATVELYHQVPKVDNEDTEELSTTEPHYMVSISWVSSALSLLGLSYRSGS